jgi:hypothetical protein
MGSLQDLPSKIETRPEPAVTQNVTDVHVTVLRLAASERKPKSVGVLHEEPL